MAAFYESGITYKTPAWHGLSKVMEHKLYNVQEAIIEAGMNWLVEKRQHFTEQTVLDESGNSIGTKFAPVPDCYGIYRISDNAYLGRVGSRYKPLQNIEAFEWFAPFLHERDVFIETAGSLHGGRVIFVGAMIEGAAGEVVDGDVVEQRLLLTNSHDATVSLSAMFVNTRVVCANTLAVAQNEALKSGKFINIRHTSSMQDKLKEVQSQIDLARRCFNESLDMYRQLAQVQMTTEQFRNYLEGLFESELSKENDEGEKRTLYTYEPTKRILTNFDETPDLQLDGVRGTAWAGANAISEYVTWQSKSRTTDSRVSSMLFGDNRKLLERSFEKLLALA